MDLVEVAPHYDPSGITCFLAAQLLMNFLGFIFHERGGHRQKPRRTRTRART
jgi:agmatinase